MSGRFRDSFSNKKNYGSLGHQEADPLLDDSVTFLGSNQINEGTVNTAYTSDVWPAENGVGGDHSHKDPESADDDSVGRALPIKAQVRQCCRDAFTLQAFLNKFPIIKWLPKYRLDTFQADLIAGLTVGLTVIPQGLAYASIAGLEPQYGLYSAFMGCFVYTLMGTSKDITLGPTAIMSLMTATFGSSPIESNRHDPTIAVILCLLSGVIQFAMGILKLGILVNYISYPVINAFTSAAAITIAFGQIKYILGLKDVEREFLHMVYDTFRKIPETRVFDLTMGVICLIVVILLKKLRTIKYKSDDDPDAQVPLPLIVLRKLIWLIGTGANVVIVLVAAGVVAIMEIYGVDDKITVTGNITAGLPPFRPPKFSIHDGNTTISSTELLSDVGAGIIIVPLLGLVETMAIGKAFARANNYKIDPTQELLAIGSANILSSFVSSYPITGSFSRTAVNSQSGVRTPMAGVWTGGLVILALCLLTPWFYYIPKAALAAVIIAAVIQMVDYHIIIVLWRANKWDLVPLFVTFICSLCVGIEWGILIGIGVSLLMLLYPMARPKIKYTVKSGVLFVTPLQGLNFPAAEYLEMKAMDKATSGEKPRNIILNLEHLSDLDYTAIQSLKTLSSDCGQHDMRLILANAQGRVTSLIRAANIKDLTAVPSIKHALDELNVQDDGHNNEEEEPFMSRL